MRSIAQLNSMLLAGLFFGVTLADASAQAPAKASAGAELVTFTTQEDHRQMMQQLGITALRPGPSGSESAPNHANYDESLANPFPKLPDPLTLKDGEKVATAAQWWTRRRPEIVEDFEREVYGRVPKNVPRVTWSVSNTGEIVVGGVPAVEKQLRGQVDNASCPAIEVNISMTLVTPKTAEGRKAAW